MEDQYLQPTDILDSNHPVVKKFVKNAVGNETSLKKKASLLFASVRDKIVYDPYVAFYRPEHYQASKLIKKGRGYCVCKACVLCAVARAANIPSRLGFATIRNHGASETVVQMLGCDLFVYHGYTEFFLDNKWIKATPAFDLPVCEKHNILLPEFDGVHDTVLPSKDLAGNLYVEYITDHATYPDLPLKALLCEWGKIYGKDRMDLWIQALESVNGSDSWRNAR